MKRREFIQSAGMFMFATSVGPGVGLHKFANLGNKGSEDAINIGVLLPDFGVWNNGVDIFQANLQAAMSGSHTVNFVRFPMTEIALYKQSLQSGKLSAGITAPTIWNEETGNASALFNGFFSGKSPESFQTWLDNGGLALWEKLYKDLNLVPRLFTKSPGLRGGWANREISQLSDFDGMLFNSGCPIVTQNLQHFGAVKDATLNPAETAGHFYERVCTHFDFAENLHQKYPYYYSVSWSNANLWTSYNLEISFNADFWVQASADLKHKIMQGQRKAEQAVVSQWDGLDSAAREQIVAAGVRMRDFPQAFTEQVFRLLPENLAAYLQDGHLKDELIAHYTAAGAS